MATISERLKRTQTRERESEVRTLLINLATGVKALNDDLKSFLGGHVVCEQWSLAEVSEQILDLPDVAVINRYLDDTPDGDQLEALIMAFRKQSPKTRFVIIIGDYEEQLVSRIVNLGVFDVAIGQEISDGTLRDLIQNPRKSFDFARYYAKADQQEVPGNTLRTSVARITEKLTAKRHDTVQEPIEIVTAKDLMNQHPEYNAIESRLILVMNGTARGGSTFVSLLLARALAVRNLTVSVIEPAVPDKLPYICEHLMLRLNGTPVSFDVDKIAESNGSLFSARLQDDTTEHNGITLQLLDPKGSANLNLEGHLKLLAARNTAIKIVDCGSLFEDEIIRELAAIAHRVYVVVDLLPGDSNVSSFTRWKDYHQQGNLRFIINRSNPGIDAVEKQQLQESLSPFEISLVEPSRIYAALYRQMLPYDDPSIRKAIESQVEALLKDMLPDQVHRSLHKRGFNFFKGRKV